MLLNTNFVVLVHQLVYVYLLPHSQFVNLVYSYRFTSLN